MKTLLILTSLLVSINTFSQMVERSTYLEYTQEINSIRHTLKKNESISEILFDKGYEEKLYPQGGLVDQTLWKNGILKKDSKSIPVGFELKLPYDPMVARKFKEKKSISNKRKPASTANMNYSNIKNIHSTKNESWLEQTKLQFLPTLGYRKIQTNQSNSNLSSTALSKLSYGLEADWKHHWNDEESWSTSIGFKIMQYKFEVSSNKKLLNPEQTYSKIYISGSYSYGNKKHHSITTTLGTDREQTLKALNQNELVIESVTAPSLELNHHLRILEHKNLEAYWDVGAGAIFASDNGTKTGKYFETNLGVFYKRPWGMLKSSINYKNLDLDVQDGNQTTQDAGMTFGVQLDF